MFCYKSILRGVSVEKIIKKKSNSNNKLQHILQTKDSHKKSLRKYTRHEKDKRKMQPRKFNTKIKVNCQHHIISFGWSVCFFFFLCSLHFIYDSLFFFSLLSFSFCLFAQCLLVCLFPKIMCRKKNVRGIRRMRVPSLMAVKMPLCKW